MSQNNPNPFDRSTQIDINLPNDGQVQLHVFDINGKMVYQSNKAYNKGMNNIIIDAEDILGNNGIYYYRISFNDQSITRKMIMIE